MYNNELDSYNQFEKFSSSEMTLGAMNWHGEAHISKNEDEMKKVIFMDLFIYHTIKWTILAVIYFKYFIDTQQNEKV